MPEELTAGQKLCQTEEQRALVVAAAARAGIIMEKPCGFLRGYKWHLLHDNENIREKEGKR